MIMIMRITMIIIVLFVLSICIIYCYCYYILFIFGIYIHTHISDIENTQAHGNQNTNGHREDARVASGDVPEARYHLGKADDLLDAVADEVGEVGQHGEAGALLLVGLGPAALPLVHHQQVTEVHQLGVHRLCGKSTKEGGGVEKHVKWNENMHALLLFTPLTGVWGS